MQIRSENQKMNTDDEKHQIIAIEKDSITNDILENKIKKMLSKVF